MQVWFSRKQSLRESLVCKVFIKEYPNNQHCGKRARKKDWYREEVSCGEADDSLSIPAGSSREGRVFQSSCESRQNCPPQSVIGCRPP